MPKILTTWFMDIRYKVLEWKWHTSLEMINDRKHYAFLSMRGIENSFLFNTLVLYYTVLSVENWRFFFSKQPQEDLPKCVKIEMKFHEHDNNSIYSQGWKKNSMTAKAKVCVRLIFEEDVLYNLEGRNRGGYTIHYSLESLCSIKVLLSFCH